MSSNFPGESSSPGHSAPDHSADLEMSENSPSSDNFIFYLLIYRNLPHRDQCSLYNFDVWHNVRDALLGFVGHSALSPEEVLNQLETKFPKGLEQVTVVSIRHYLTHSLEPRPDYYRWLKADFAKPIWREALLLPLAGATCRGHPTPGGSLAPGSLWEGESDMNKRKKIILRSVIPVNFLHFKDPL
jgi:hypothetical protein